jgi:putative transposase
MVGISRSRSRIVAVIRACVRARAFRRKRFGTLEPADVKRLRQVEQENGRLKKMVADRDLEIDVLKEITRKKW